MHVERLEYEQGRCVLLPLDTLDSLPLARRWVWQADAGRKLEPEVRFEVHEKLASGQPAPEHVATGAPVRGDEVEMVAGYVQTLGVVGEAEADEASRDIAKLEGGLVFDDVYEKRIRLSLAGYAARLDVLELPVHPDGAAACSLQEIVYATAETVKIYQRVEL